MYLVLQFSNNNFSSQIRLWDWSCGPRGREPALQAWIPELKPESYQKKNLPDPKYVYVSDQGLRVLCFHRISFYARK
jgi:hypothetical protein